MKLAEKHKKLIGEFLRYVLVGGVSAVVDMAVNYTMLFWLLGGTKDDRGLVAISVACGFLVGLAANYILSNCFVFKSEAQKKRGRTFVAFLIYAAVGIVGFFLTELLTLLGTLIISDSGIGYLILSCFVKGAVLIWNYTGRKLLVYKGQ